LTFEKLNFFTGDPSAKPLDEAFGGCPYQIVLLAGASLLDEVLAAMQMNDCDVENTHVGAFDTNDDMYQAIRDGQVDFTISQQLALQGSLVVVMAALYATTGKKLAAASSSYTGAYQTGPHLITPINVPDPGLQVCESNSFPLCGDDTFTNSLVGTSAGVNFTSISTDAVAGHAEGVCKCADRRAITLAGITHGDTSSGFWDTPYAAMEQAAADFGVTVHLPRLDPPREGEDFDGLIEKMAKQIRGYCEERVDGVFTSIPSDAVVEAIRFCQELGVPVVSLNSGADVSEELGLMNHVGQLEFRAGKEGGKFLLREGVTRGLCLYQESNNAGLFKRCDGMKEAFEESEGAGQYLGAVYTPPGDENNEVIIEEAIGESGSWKGVGILAGGTNLLPHVFKVQEIHSDVKVGVFDTSPELYEGLEDKRLLFGIDQNSYLQGYLPVALLTWYAHTRQKLVDQVLESGPDFVLAAPTEGAQQCQSVFYAACKNTELTRNRTIDETSDSLGVSVAAAVSIVSIAIAGAWAFIV